MPTDVLLWAITAPSMLAGVIFLVGIAPWRGEERDDAPRGSWAAGPAIAVGYGVGQWGLVGWQPLGGDITQWLIYLALVAAAVGVLEASRPLPLLLRLPLRLAVSSGAAFLLLRPLVQNGAVSAPWIAAVAAAMLLVWTVVELLAREERGPALAVFIAILAGGVAATVLFAGNATTAMLAGALIATLGALTVLSLKWPATARLRSAAPVVAVLAVGQLTVGRFYTDGMPALSFLLLLASPLALLGAHLVLRQRSTLLAVAGRLAALGAPVAIAAALAASAYFAPPASQGSSLGAGASRSSAKAPGAAKAKSKKKGKWDGDYGYDF